MALPNINDYTDLGILGIQRPKGLDALSVRHQNVMAGLIPPRLVVVSGGKESNTVACIGGNGLIDGGPHGNHITKGSEHFVGVLAKPLDGVAVHPTASVLQSLRKIPMVEGNVGHDAVLIQLLKDTLVVVHALFIELTDTVGQYTGPGNGQTVRVNTKIYQVFQITVEHMVAVAGNGGGGTVADLVGLSGKRVPNGSGTAVIKDSSLNLTCAGGGPPNKIFREWHNLNLLYNKISS